MQPFNFHNVKSIEFGSRSSAKLATFCSQLGIAKPIIITDSGIIDLGLLEPVLHRLSQANIAYSIFSEVVADPPSSIVDAALDHAKTNGCDGVIGFGGGSSMDVAKIVAALLISSQTLEQIYGIDQITEHRAPLIQVPTTAGTGSEVTSVAIITTGESKKTGIVSPILFADTVILDPSLTIGLPANTTAATGIDAMVHAIEAYTSIRLKNPISDMHAMQSLQLLSSNIRQTVIDGNNLEARSNMLLGAMLAGNAFANAPVGGIHDLAYPLGGIFHIPHGLSNSLVLPHVLKFNAVDAADWYIELTSFLDGFPERANHSNIGEFLFDYFIELAEDLSLPTRLRDVGVKESDLTRLSENAMQQQRLLINNPRKMNIADVYEVYTQAF